MASRLLADLVVVVHGLFVVFVLLGAFVAVRRHWIVWIHIPAAVWGVLIEYTGWICPLTPLENSLRLKGGEAGYSGGFIQHYVQPTLYPSDLTRGTQLVLGSIVLLVNLAAYAVVASRMKK